MPRDSAKLGRRSIFVDAYRLRTLWDTPTFAESGSALAATPPSTLSQSSSNVSACTHTHAILSASNPGVAASLLATSASGVLALQKLGVGTACPIGAFQLHTPDIVTAYFDSSFVTRAQLNVRGMAASEIGSGIDFISWMRDSAGNLDVYGLIRTKILDPTSDSEYSTMEFQTLNSGSRARRMTVGQGVQIGEPTGGDKGMGTINLACTLYIHGVPPASAPGAASALLQTSPSGTLFLQALTLGASSTAGASAGEISGRRDWNGDTTWNLVNASSDTAAQARLMIENVDYDVQLGIYSACTTAYGAISPCRAFLYTDAIDGLTIMADTGAIMFAAGDNASNARLTGGGQLQLPTTGSNAGALLGGDVRLWRQAAGVLAIGDSASQHNQISNAASTATVFNETGADIDFRVEGDTEPNLLFVDAGANRIGIGTACPIGAFQLHTPDIVTAYFDSSFVTRAQLNVRGMAASEIGSGIDFISWMRDSASNLDVYGLIRTKILDPASDSEYSTMEFQTLNSGSRARRMTVGQGVQIGEPTGGDKGSGTLNIASEIYLNNVAPSSSPGTNAVLLRTDPNGKLTLSSSTGTVFNSTTTASNSGAVRGIADVELGTGVYGSGNAASGVGVYGFVGALGSASSTAGYFLQQGAGYGLDVVGKSRFTTGGIQIGAPTGGDKGAGTLNVATEIYKNNSAYNNPAYALELWATGKIEKHAGKDGARDYRRATLEEAERHIHETFELPGHKADFGLFNGGDWLLEKVEELYTYIIELHRRIQELESTQANGT